MAILQSESRDIDQITRKKVAYEIEEADDKETKHAIELHKLFVDGRYRDFIKGKKNFSKKYPRPNTITCSNTCKLTRFTSSSLASIRPVTLTRSS